MFRTTHRCKIQAFFEGSFEAARPTTLKLPAPRRWVNPRYRLLLQSIAAPDTAAAGAPPGGQDPSAFARLGVFAASAGAVPGASDAGSHAFDVSKLPPSARSMVLAAAALLFCCFEIYYFSKQNCVFFD